MSMTAMPRTDDQLSPRAREIVAAARELLDEEGGDGLSMRRVAERLGIRAPSIYKHLTDKEALEDAIISDGFAELAAAFAPAVAARDPLPELAAAYRRFAAAHPHLYRLMTERPLRRERLAPGAEEAAAAPVIAAVGGDEHLARAVWAFAHGMTILELNGRFPPGADLDAAWERGIAAFQG
jgi:AcrR family transcriptional regulator